MAFINLFFMFFRIGIFSFGGGYAMLPLIFQSIQDFGVMTSGEFSRLVALSQVTPGPVAVNAATYVGYHYAGIGGSAVATVGVALPSMILIILAMRFLDQFEENQSLNAVLQGIRPATVGLISSAVVFLAETSVFQGPILSMELIHHLETYVNWLPCGIFAGTILLAGRFGFGPIKLTLLAGVIGALLIR